MPIPDTSTTQALQRLPGAKSHRSKCVALGLPVTWRGTVGRIIYGHAVSLDKENTVRARLGLPPIALPQIPVTPCPSCAARGITRSHGDGLDCNGNGGTAIVLAPNETVRRPTRRKRPVVRRPWMGVELSSAMDAAGMSDATVRWLVTRHIYEQELAGKAGREGGV